MKKNVVYILGAGFSAPIGIPVMRDFVDVARKIKRDGGEKLQYFNDVIKLIQETVFAKSYFNHDPGNIEEALSLLEMKENLSVGQEKAKVIQFIVDIIENSTPPNPKFIVKEMPSQDWGFLFTKDPLWQGYCAFVASLFNLQFREALDYEKRGISAQSEDGEIQYTIVSMNYDMLLENVCLYLQDSYWWPKEYRISFRKEGEAELNGSRPLLLKIHGSVDTKEIIPPTVIKGLYTKDMPQSWLLAYDSLVKANEIRVIGYSLPQTDSYIKYLMMASIQEMRDLDRLDWIVRDNTGEVEKRFEEFVTFKGKRFKKGNTLNYLSSIFGHTVNPPRSSPRILNFQNLEVAHEDFMTRKGSEGRL